jgi:3,4-dihydroxy-2-butanone 4-phosphate synthase
MSITAAIAALKAGNFIIITDGADREDEADLVIAAEAVTEAQMAFLIQETSGIITVPLLPERLEVLELPLLATENTANFGTPFAMPVDLKGATRGGVSAAERVATIRALIDPATHPGDLGRPGHVFPLRVHPEGIAGRQGHTEAAMALVQEAGLYPGAVLGELMNADGTMLRGNALSAFAARHHFPVVSIAEIISALE